MMFFFDGVSSLNLSFYYTWVLQIQFTYILARKDSFQNINNFVFGLVFPDYLVDELLLLLARYAGCL